jgi:hypothetical protein
MKEDPITFVGFFYLLNSFLPKESKITSGLWILLTQLACDLRSDLNSDRSGKKLLFR